MATKYYKFLSGLKACHGGSYTYELGVWTPEIEDIRECKSGYHLCKSDQLIDWLAPDLYECEAEGVVELDNKCVAKRIKLVRKVETWNKKTARLLAVWCARQVQHLLTDHRSIAALDVAERHANGDATDEELAEAAQAAQAAAEAAWAAAWDAARAAQSAKLKEMLGI